MDRSRLSIVIPALNESATIVEVVRRAGLYGIPIVVDDGSTDDTAKLAERAGATVVSHRRTRGYDAALDSGFANAATLGSEMVITLDADGQHDPCLIQKFVNRIEAGDDVVVGIRSKRQRLAEHLFALYTSARFGIDDPLCGMKAYRTVVYEALGHFDSYGSIGTELMVFAAKRGYRIGQVPVAVRERNGQSRFGQVVSANCRIVRALAISIFRST